MDSLDNDERLEYEAVVDPFMEIDCMPEIQTGSDWYALALSASLGGKALHGFTFATTTETLGKTNLDYASKHTCGWIKTNEASLNVEHPGDEWDEVVRPTRLHTGVVTGSQLSLMFDTDSWEPSSAARARNAAFLAAGLVTHGSSMSEATELASTISGEEVNEAAIVNTIVPVSHLKREAAGVAKHSHAIFSRMNAQRFISWADSQLHEGILPENASIDWAKITVVARYIAEANMRYDPNFRKLAHVVGVPYTIVKGSWAYVGKEDYRLTSRKWKEIDKPISPLLDSGSLAKAYASHTARLTTQVMRTYNELASSSGEQSLEALLDMAMGLRTRRTTKRISVQGGTDVLSETVGHQQSASIAANLTATSATSHNALVQAFGELVLPQRALVQQASYIVAVNRRFEEVVGSLAPFFPYLASRHTWLRAFELLDAMIGNPRTTLERMNRLHRSITNSSQTIEVDVPLTGRARQAMGPHLVAIIKKMLVRAPPTVAIPRYITSVRGAVQRGEHANLLRRLGDHLDEYRNAWAERYEDWARVHALSGLEDSKAKSIVYGATARAFRSITANNIASSESRFVDGANVKASYLFGMAADYAKKRRLKKPDIPTRPIGGAREYAEMLDKQYRADVSFVTVEEFVYARLKMFHDDLALDIEPTIPDMDEPMVERTKDEVEEYEDDLEAELAKLLAESSGDAWGGVTPERVAATYPAEYDPDVVAKVMGFDSFLAAYETHGEAARWDTEGAYTRDFLQRNANSVEQEEELDEGITIG